MSRTQPSEPPLQNMHIEKTFLLENVSVLCCPLSSEALETERDIVWDGECVGRLRGTSASAPPLSEKDDPDIDAFDNEEQRYARLLEKIYLWYPTFVDPIQSKDSKMMTGLMKWKNIFIIETKLDVTPLTLNLSEKDAHGSKVECNGKSAKSVCRINTMFIHAILYLTLDTGKRLCHLFAQTEGRDPVALSKGSTHSHTENNLSRLLIFPNPNNANISCRPTIME